MARGVRFAAGAAIALVAAAVAVAAPAPRPYVVHDIDVDVSTPTYALAPDPPVASGRLAYRLSWAGLPVGRAWVDVQRSTTRRGKALAVHVAGTTSRAIDLLFRYRVDAHSVLFTQPFGPAAFAADECENDHLRRTVIQFPEDGDRVRSFRTSKGFLKEYTFHSRNTFDIGSTIFLVLNLDYAPGARFALDTFTGTARYLVDVVVDGRERIERAGRHEDAWRLRVHTSELTGDGRDDGHRETLVWISDERPRRLLRARSSTWVGSISLELDDSPDGARPPRVRHGDACA